MVVCNRYATSLFQLTIDEKIDISSELNEVNALFLENTELFDVFCAENILTTDKIAILEKLFKGKISTILYNFIAVLIEKKRINLWKQIYIEFFAIYNENKKILTAFATTAIELDNSQKDKILAKISKITGRNVEITYNVNPDIIGGIIIKYDNTLIDDSIKNRLKNLNKQIKEVGV